MSEKAEYARLARVFREAANAAGPQFAYFQQYFPEGAPQSYLMGAAPISESEIEDQKRRTLVSSILGAIADAYQRAADESD